MSDNKAPEFHVTDRSERRNYLFNIIAALNGAMEASSFHKDDKELEYCARAHDLLSEVIGR